MVITLVIGVTFGLAATMLIGYHRLGSEARVATVETRQLAPQRYEVDLTFPDGSRRSAEIEGDQWQLDARVIKWRSTALLRGAQPLYRLDRLSGRYRRIEDTTKPMTAVDLAADDLFDLADVKQGDAERAISAYRDALKLAPNDPSLLGNLGEAQRVAGNIADALISLLAAAELEGAGTRRAARIGLLLSDLGRDGEAMAWLQRSTNDDDDFR